MQRSIAIYVPFCDHVNGIGGAIIIVVPDLGFHLRCLFGGEVRQEGSIGRTKTFGQEACVLEYVFRCCLVAITGLCKGIFSFHGSSTTTKLYVISSIMIIASIVNDLLQYRNLPPRLFALARQQCTHGRRCHFPHISTIHGNDPIPNTNLLLQRTILSYTGYVRWTTRSRRFACKKNHAQFPRRCQNVNPLSFFLRIHRMAPTPRLTFHPIHQQSQHLIILLKSLPFVTTVTVDVMPPPRSRSFHHAFQHVCKWRLVLAILLK
mmetsp:Transcript_24495/g.52986  ORF Transcript_24495/g.52986 Transcript_24495/m.52986 type:complete len:263 (+) Transcript_24495:668-1456(+)